ncbi:MAG: hypothetical protein KIT33_10785 [Candidatus Kapabacteria bacterium]|nr:hypothetical protein [Ignavibacteriota bacterium]MCW5885446.1 hypothetical protein [Candidatus Kapabacteria bacterium]
MSKIYIFAIAIFALAFVACTENNTNVNAEKMALEKMAKTPGFTWIYLEMDKYEPKAEILPEIQRKFNSAEHTFIVFAKPSCSCPGKHLQTPAFLKTLETAGIPLDKCELYSLSSINNNHPYESTIKLKDLPTIIVMKAGKPVYSVSDTINTITNANPNSGITVEDALLLGLTE